MQNKNILHIHQNPIKHGVVFEFEDDDYFCNGGFGITLDDTITFEENDLINAAATLIISGYFLPSQIIFDNTFKLASNKNFNLILQMIYDIRACS